MIPFNGHNLIARYFHEQSGIISSRNFIILSPKTAPSLARFFWLRDFKSSSTVALEISKRSFERARLPFDIFRSYLESHDRNRKILRRSREFCRTFFHFQILNESNLTLISIISILAFLLQNQHELPGKLRIITSDVFDTNIPLHQPPLDSPLHIYQAFPELIKFHLIPGSRKGTRTERNARTLRPTAVQKTSVH